MPADQTRDEGHHSKYFHMMLNMDDDDLDPFEYRLLGHYRRRGTCREAISTTAKVCRMDVKTVREVRERLKNMGYLDLNSQPGKPIIITIKDRMPENVARYSKTPAENGRGQGATPSENGVGDTPKTEGVPLPKTVAKEEPIKEDSSKKNLIDSAKGKKPSRKPGADLTEAMFIAIPIEIRPPKPDYRKNYIKADELFATGHTPQEVSDFVDWKYATNDWMWTGSDGTPVIITMGMVANNIKAASGKVKEWIADGRPRRTQQAQEAAKVEKPFDPETDPDNPKNWPKGITPSPEAIARYAQFVADKMKENANGHTQLYQPGGKDLLPAGTGITGSAPAEPRQLDLSLVPRHGSGDVERTG